MEHVFCVLHKRTFYASSLVLHFILNLETFPISCSFRRCRKYRQNKKGEEEQLLLKEVQENQRLEMQKAKEEEAQRMIEKLQKESEHNYAPKRGKHKRKRAVSSAQRSRGVG